MQRPSAIERHSGSSGSGVDVGPSVALTAIARIRAVEVLPVPRGPVKR